MKLVMVSSKIDWHLCLMNFSNSSDNSDKSEPQWNTKSNDDDHANPNEDSGDENG